MTDRSNDVPGDDLVPTPDEAAEESPDLTDAEIAAASDAAADEVSEAEAGGETLEEAEAYDAEEALEGDGTDDDALAPARPDRRLRASEAAARHSASGRREVRGPKPTRTTFPIDPALRIKDPASAAFVLASIGVFLLIFLNAMAFGHGGAFTPVRTPAPIVSPSPGPSSSPGASGSAAPSGSASSAPSVAPTAAPTAGPSAAPTSTAPAATGS